MIYGIIALVVYVLEPRGLHAIIRNAARRPPFERNGGAVTWLFELREATKRFGGLAVP